MGSDSGGGAGGVGRFIGPPYGGFQTRRGHLAAAMAAADEYGETEET